MYAEAKRSPAIRESLLAGAIHAEQFPPQIKSRIARLVHPVLAKYEVDRTGVINAPELQW
jgi:hypothetical protein